MIDWRGQGHSSRRLRDPRKGYVRDFADYETDVETFIQQVVMPDCPPPFYALAHSMGGAVMLRVAHAQKRWFDRIVLSAPMIDLPGRTHVACRRARCCALRWIGRGGQYVPAGSDQLIGTGPLSPIRSPPIRCATRATRRCWRKTRRSGLPRRRSPGRTPPSAPCTTFQGMNYPSQIRQPVLMLAAGSDTIVSTPAIEEFAYHMRAGSHLVIAGAKHELLQEQDRYREQFWAAFDAFVPGTPLFK